MSFVEVKLIDWDCSKVSIGIPPKGTLATVLYEDGGNKKLPILCCAGNAQQKYVLTSFDGLNRNMKYDSAKKQFLDVWEGDWSIYFKICRSVDSASALERKLLDIFEDIVSKAKNAYEEEPANPVGYKYLTETNKFGVVKIIGVDTSKPAGIKIKVGFDAPADAPTFVKDGKQVPTLESRYPKAKFYNVHNARDQMLIANGDKEKVVGVALNAVPKFLIGIYKAGKDGKLYITKKLMHMYYEPTVAGGSLNDDGIIEMLRNTDAELEQY